MNSALYHRLAPVIRRVRFRRLMITLAAIWFCLAIVVSLLIYLNQQSQLNVVHWWLPCVALVLFASAIGIFLGRRSAKEFQSVIQDLERQFPDLDSSLLTAIEQKSVPGQSMGFLQQDVLRRAVNHSFSNRWISIVPGWQLFLAPLTSVLAFGLLIGALASMIAFAKPILENSSLLFSEVVVENSNFEISIEPGNTEIERGSSLLVLARFAGAIPPESVLVYEAADGEPIRLAMNKSLDDPVFGTRIASVSEPIRYWVEFAQRQSDPFAISVFEFPELVRTDATLHFPQYTKLADKTVQDVRRVSAVEGTDVQFSFYVNKELAAATLVPIDTADDRVNKLPSSSQSLKSLDPIVLNQDPTDPRKLTANLRMLASTKFELRLLDADGRENRFPPKLILNVFENQVPDLKLTAPRRDVQVSAIEELGLAATAWDDFGINALGLNFSIAGQAANELVLLKDGIAKQHHEVNHLLEFESLKAQPDELLSYYFWVEDLGPDGQSRRVESDMFFAEVRHFDEIFRQGQAPPAGDQPPGQPGQSGQNAEAAQQLAELQKEIINATWKMIRRENRTDVSDEFSADVQLLVDSQGDVIMQLVELAAEIDDASSRSFVDAATTHMKEAIIHLTDAKAKSSADSLQPALGSEQAAYQAMLKLRAREHEVVRAQQQPGQQGQQAGSRAQQQMEQLNLKDDENRYENEKMATDPQQNTEQREDRQVLSRLRELARRQEDLNDRIKELQSALEKAVTQEEKEEIERRLKSLRDQQQQMLRDTDELLDRMQQSENQQRMADEAEQLEQTRESLREASEALDEGQVSRAAADGTRAQRNLEELRDEFQNRTAGQFTEQMREMRNEAQDLEKKEQQIGDELANENTRRQSNDKPPSLRSEEDSPDVSQQLKEQQDSVNRLRERMQETIEEAEAFEPLLAEQLYETYRESERSRPDRNLESARESLERGWLDDAQTQEQNAREGITQMREGIEKAADSVLGDETEALQAAQNTLRELNDQVQQELSRAQDSKEGAPTNQQSQNREQQSGEPSPNGEAGSSASDQPPGDEPRNGQGRGQQNSNAQPPGENNEPQNGEPQENAPGSEPQSGEAQEGQAQNEPGQGGQSPGNSQGGEPQDGDRQNGDGQPSQPRQLGQRGTDQPNAGDDRRGGFQSSGGGNLRTMQPISGEDFREWSDRLRDVEEMMSDPDLRSEAARIRDAAKQIRREANRHSVEPNWDLVKLKIAKPLAELQDRVAEELLRRSSSDALVPLDRDPIPTQYQDAVRRYYERIGSGQ